MILAIIGAISALVASLYYTRESYKLGLGWLCIVFLALDIKLLGMAILLYSTVFDGVPKSITSFLMSPTLNVPLVLVMLFGTIKTLLHIRQRL